MKKWYKLDNAAKIFPATATTENSSIYRISFILKEEIDPSKLQEALDLTINRFPTFKVEIKNGFFWNYLKTNEKKLLVKEEKNYPCSPMLEENNNYLIRILYYKNKIALETFHSLTDGSGAITFLKTLTYQYLTLCGKEIDPDNKILLPDEVSAYFEEEDSFDKNYHKRKITKEKHPKSYRIYGTPFDKYGNNTIHGIVKVQDIKRVAKEYNMSMTEFLTTLLVYSICTKTMKYHDAKEPIVVALPVNLRKFYESKTLRNFFCVVNVEVYCKRDMTFDEIGKIVKEEIKNKVNKEYLDSEIIKNNKLERNILIKLIPLYLKNILLSYGFDIFGENKKTITFSNLGNIDIPDDMNKYIDNSEVILYPTKKSPINCSASSIGDNLTITFIRTIKENDIIRHFFKYLANTCDLEVKVYSNEWGVTNE